jgi:hypothetical protein
MTLVLDRPMTLDASVLDFLRARPALPSEVLQHFADCDPKDVASAIRRLVQQGKLALADGAALRLQNAA